MKEITCKFTDCQYTWTYNGKKKITKTKPVYITCPNCLRKNKVIKWHESK
jgi:hypothetical protein